MLEIIVHEIRGKCPVHKVGDRIIVDDPRILLESTDALCTHALSSILHYNLVLDAGADPDAQGPGPGAETYRWATRNGHHNIIQLLNQSKAGVKFYEGPEEKAQTVPSILRKPQQEEEPVPEPAEEKEGSWI